MRSRIHPRTQASEAGLAARGELVKQMESMNEKLMPPRIRDIESASTASLGSRQGLERTVTPLGERNSTVGAIFPSA